MKFDLIENVRDENQYKKNRRAGYAVLLFFGFLFSFGELSDAGVYAEVIDWYLLSDTVFVFGIFVVLYCIFTAPFIYSGRGYHPTFGKMTKPQKIGDIEFSEKGFCVNGKCHSFDLENDRIEFKLEGYKGKRSVDGSGNQFIVTGKNSFDCFFRINEKEDSEALSKIFLSYYEQGYALFESHWGQQGRTYLMKGGLDYKEIQEIKKRHNIAKWV